MVYVRQIIAIYGILITFFSFLGSDRLTRADGLVLVERNLSLKSEVGTEDEWFRILVTSNVIHNKV